jgi:hypothetical protein
MESNRNNAHRRFGDKITESGLLNKGITSIIHG